MNELGNKIASKRKDLGLTQTDFAEKLNVTRQTVSRWESGAVMPDIDKIGDIATVLEVSCDYLLKDDIVESNSPVNKGASRLLEGLTGKKVKFAFFDGEADIDLYDTECRIIDFEGNWIKIEAYTKKNVIEKLIPLSSVLSFEIVEEK